MLFQPHFYFIHFVPARLSNKKTSFEGKTKTWIHISQRVTQHRLGLLRPALTANCASSYGGKTKRNATVAFQKFDP